MNTFVKLPAMEEAERRMIMNADMRTHQASPENLYLEMRALGLSMQMACLLANRWQISPMVMCEHNPKNYCDNCGNEMTGNRLFFGLSKPVSLCSDCIVELEQGND